MANKLVFTDEEMAVDEGLGHPKAFGQLCRDRSLWPYSHGPPFTFNPLALAKPEDSGVKELDELFPIIDPKAKPTTKPNIFLSLLWKQLNHLGNAGFDPEVIRVDSYGNVLYYHADAASPLAWDIDHWFPCSRGGLTVPSNLRILQWHVYKRKHNKLEFLIPWWDFQIGISINQFLSIFASSNSDFRHRAFSWLFSEGESEELNSSQTVESHVFPQHYLELKGRLGLAPAALVLSRRESSDAPLKSLDLNRQSRFTTPIVALKKSKHFTDEKENALMAANPYRAIALARDSLKQREETAKIHAEIEELDNEVCELQQKTEEEKVSIQELELVLIKKRRRAEKCRRLAESQCSYRAMLEKMIRDAMHQSVVYKEQVRLNQAAASALLARLEAQKAICDSAERQLNMKYKQRYELEKQIKPEWAQASKRSRMDNAIPIEGEIDAVPLGLMANEQEMDTNDTKKAVLYLSEHKELWKFLEEEQSPTGAGIEGPEGGKEMNSSFRIMKPGKNDNDNEERGYIIEERLGNLEMENGGKVYSIQFPFPHKTEDEEEDEESRRLRGKGNIEKWLQFLLKNTPEDDPETKSEKSTDESRVTARTNELINKLNTIMQESTQAPENDEKTEGKKQLCTNTPFSKNPPYIIVAEKRNEKEWVTTGKEARRMSSPDESIVKGTAGKERELSRSESARAFRRIPSSPSLILKGMKKRVDCMRKKPSVLDHDNAGDEDYASRSSFIKSSIKTLRRAVKI